MSKQRGGCADGCRILWGNIALLALLFVGLPILFGFLFLKLLVAGVGLLVAAFFQPVFLLFIRYVYILRFGYIHAWILRRSSDNAHSRLSRFDIVSSSGRLLHIHCIPCLSDNYCYLIVDAGYWDGGLHRIHQTVASSNVADNEVATVDAQPPACLENSNLNCLQAIVIDVGDSVAVWESMKSISRGTYGGRHINLEAILTTHHHWDHQGGNRGLWAKFGKALRVYGSSLDRIDCLTHTVEDGTVMSLGDGSMTFEVMATPCHTLGSVIYRLRCWGQLECLFTGDTLFLGGCGNMFEGSRALMSRNFWRIERECHPDALVFPGHEYTCRILSELIGSSECPSAPSEYFALCSSLLRARQLRNLSPPAPTVPYVLREELRYNPNFRPAKELASTLRRCWQVYEATVCRTTPSGTTSPRRELMTGERQQPLRTATCPQQRGNVSPLPGQCWFGDEAVHRAAATTSAPCSSNGVQTATQSAECCVSMDYASCFPPAACASASEVCPSDTHVLPQQQGDAGGGGAAALATLRTLPPACSDSEHSCSVQSQTPKATFRATDELHHPFPATSSSFSLPSTVLEPSRRQPQIQQFHTPHLPQHNGRITTARTLLTAGGHGLLRPSLTFAQSAEHMLPHPERSTDGTEQYSEPEALSAMTLISEPVRLTSDLRAVLRQHVESSRPLSPPCNTPFVTVRYEDLKSLELSLHAIKFDTQFLEPAVSQICTLYDPLSLDKLPTVPPRYLRAAPSQPTSQSSNTRKSAHASKPSGRAKQVVSPKDLSSMLLLLVKADAADTTRLASQRKTTQASVTCCRRRRVSVSDPWRRSPPIERDDFLFVLCRVGRRPLSAGAARRCWSKLSTAFVQYYPSFSPKIDDPALGLGRLPLQFIATTLAVAHDVNTTTDAPSHNDGATENGR